MLASTPNQLPLPTPISTNPPTTQQAKQDATELQEQSKGLKAKISELEEREKNIIAERDAALVPIGNIVHDSVPISDNEVGGREGERVC